LRGTQWGEPTTATAWCHVPTLVAVFGLSCGGDLLFCLHDFFAAKDFVGNLPSGVWLLAFFFENKHSGFNIPLISFNISLNTFKNIC
jgi:hypothetical protein